MSGGAVNIPKHSEEEGSDLETGMLYSTSAHLALAVIRVDVGKFIKFYRSLGDNKDRERSERYLP